MLPETKGKTLEDIEKIFSVKYNPDGTLKESANVDKNTGINGESGIAASKSIYEVSDQRDKNGNKGVENGNSPVLKRMNPIDSEDEEEEDGSLVTAPL